MKIGIIPKIGSEALAIDTANILTNVLKHTVIVAPVIHQEDIFKIEDLDCMITIGGDGIVLATINGMLNKTIPIFGIHDGHLGFLTACDTIDFPSKFIAWVQEGCPTIKYKFIEYKSRVKHEIGFNEIAILSSETGKLVSIDLYIDSVFIRNVRGDGIVIATENGSTAYGLSAGGPLVHPDANTLVVVPNNEFNLRSRPIIIPRTSIVTLIMGGNVSIIRDGRFVERLILGDCCTITGSDKTIGLAPGDKSFFEKIGEKL